MSAKHRAVLGPEVVAARHRAHRAEIAGTADLPTAGCAALVSGVVA